MLAMERGEVDGALTSWNTLKRTKQQWLQNRDINVLVQYGTERHPEMRDVPTVLEIAKTPEGRAALAFYIGGAELGRSLVAPPGLPAERVKVLRAAFDAMLKDPRLPGRDREERAGVLSGLGRRGAEAHPAAAKRPASSSNAPRRSSGSDVPTLNSATLMIHSAAF